jgi:hypothetical protein
MYASQADFDFGERLGKFLVANINLSVYQESECGQYLPATSRLPSVSSVKEDVIKSTPKNLEFQVRVFLQGDRMQRIIQEQTLFVDEAIKGYKSSGMSDEFSCGAVLGLVTTLHDAHGKSIN